MGKSLNFYEVLNIPKDSTSEEIRKAYKTLVKKWHPDKHPPSSKSEAEAMFKSIAQAYEQALNEIQRKPVFAGSDPPKAGFASNSNKGWRKPPPLERKLECTLEELFIGCKKEICFDRDVMVNGSIIRKKVIENIKVKPGWKKGTRITFEGMGDELPGWLPADVIYIVAEKEHPFFYSVGDDLVMKIEIPLVNALTGWTFTFKLITGKQMTISLKDEIIYPGYVMVLQGHGMPLASGKGVRGDLRIKFQVRFPTKLSQQQRSVIQEALTNGT